MAQVSATFRFETDFTTFGEGLADAYVHQVMIIVQDVMREFAPQIEAWMKQNAPWTDRTGAARRGLNAEYRAIVGYTVAQLIVGHNVPYGPELEFDYSGRYSVIGPAIDFFAPKVLTAIAQRV